VRERWQDRIFTGHIKIGRVTIYGANAMHWAINVWFAGAYWCFHPTTRTFGATWPWYFYISPDATPQSAHFRVGDRFRNYYGEWTGWRPSSPKEGQTK
jgi:hypothetical protein